MIFDVLGIVIAFLAIILLFSILVTTIVELIQQFLQLRNGNLEQGLEAILIQYFDADTDENVKKQIKKEFLENPLPGNKLYRRILNTSWFQYLRSISWLMLLRHLKKLFGFMSPKPVSVDWDELKAQLNKQNDISIADSDFQQQINKVSTAMSQRFKSHIAFWTLAVSFAVSITFQLNTFDLMKELSTNKELREQLIDYAEGKIEETDSIHHHMRFELIAKEAIVRLEANNLSHSSVIENLTGNGAKDIEALLYELDVVSRGEPETTRKGLREELSRIVATIQKENLKKTMQHYRKSVDDISLFKFEPMPHGSDYYWDASSFSKLLHNWIGVIITALLLSLGAPYWFEVLQRLSVLRKTFTPK